MAEMGPTTPARETRMVDSDHTRQRDHLSPTPLQPRVGEKTKPTSLPPIVPGGPQRMTALQRVNGLLQEAEQQAATRRKFTNALVNSLEGIVKTFTQKEMHTVLPIQDAILTCVADVLTMGTAKESPKVLKAKESVTKTSPILTWAGVVKTPKAGGPPTAPQSGAPKANSAKKNAAKATKVDKRILARCAPFAGPRRDSPFLIRESLVKAIPGINEGDIPEVVGCKTGWALHPKSLEVRDILMKEAHKLKICEITGATRLDLPETWYNHRVRQGTKIPVQRNRWASQSYGGNGGERSPDPNRHRPG
ncbi:hypothetical protein DID88_000201 [Monilinia fructigena]|uniref:Uncharacterized protein n=1 Tax=Monilinia fructigena TaxID=38457 RepID=A0A395IJP7_9HELO|nr:hypothetical protein DID88_000201 [Monilinia fructigena]